MTSMTDRKQPGVAFWATVVVVAVLVAYPLSIGPAIWLRDQEWAPDWTFDAYRWIYAPIISVCNDGPKPFDDAMNWYANLWR